MRHGRNFRRIVVCIGVFYFPVWGASYSSPGSIGNEKNESSRGRRAHCKAPTAGASRDCASRKDFCRITVRKTGARRPVRVKLKPHYEVRQINVGCYMESNVSRTTPETRQSPARVARAAVFHITMPGDCRGNSA